MFLDFDGTLAPIVADPSAAVPHPQAVDVLGDLAERWGRVAVLSGRPVAYLSAQLGTASGCELLGLYGLERGSGGAGQIETHPSAERWRPVVAEVAAEAERRSPAGAGVERKGLTVTFHYRAAPGLAGSIHQLADELCSRTGLVPHDGKMSVELRPPLEVDKGTVIAELSDGLAAVLFAGDDLGDLPAFERLRQMRERGVTTLSVASDGPETPPPVLEAVDVAVEGPDGVIGLLRRLL